jgi:hypothetical protein
MEQVISFPVEDTQARMLALERFLHWFVLASLSISILAKMGMREGGCGGCRIVPRREGYYEQ